MQDRNRIVNNYMGMYYFFKNRNSLQELVKNTIGDKESKSVVFNDEKKQATSTLVLS